MPALLTVVGTGFQLAGHLTAESESAIRRSDLLIHAVSDGPTRSWLRTLNSRDQSLLDCYKVGRHRAETYAEMVSRILASLETNTSVCVALYGHPGVFASPGHEAIRLARAAGVEAWMLPGISAEDCLYADLEVDPGLVGSQSYEASDFLCRERTFDPTSALVLWQAGGIGVRDYREERLWNPDGLVALRERLEKAFPSDHEIIVYQTASLPISKPRIERISLGELEHADIVIASTLFVPPLRPLNPRPGANVVASEHVLPSGVPGDLTVVGLGYSVAGQVPRSATKLMASAERLFFLVVDPVSGHWLHELNPTATSLHLGYQEGESSAASVEAMVSTVMEAVEAGSKTVLATNGHPSIYMHLTHEAVRRARVAGRTARIMPGVSIEDCLIADLNVDPAQQGRTMLEGTDLVERERTIDTSTSLVILQPGAVGVRYYRPGIEAYQPGLSALAETLHGFYPSEHPIRIYERPTMPIARPVTNQVPLRDLAKAPVTVRSTLLVPPLGRAPRNHAMLERLSGHASSVPIG